MVDLHYMDAPVQAGITRYSDGLAWGLEAIGEPVRRLPVRPREVMVGRRRTGGYLSMRVQSLWNPLRKRDVLHSTHLPAAHPRADVVTVHDCIPETHPQLLGVAPWELARTRRIVERFCRRGAHFITPTQAVKTSLLQHYQTVKPDQVHVTYEGVREDFRPHQEGDATPPAFAERDAFHVLCVADLNPRKRLDWLLEAVLQAGRPEVRVVHVGADRVLRTGWVEQRAREAPLAARLGSRLQRVGHLSPAALAAAYRSADLFVLPTLDEGFGLPPLEALRSGTPVAVTDLPVLREVLGEHASYFRDADQLAGIIARAARHGRPGARERRRHHDFVRQRYPWEQAAQRTRAVYDLVRRPSEASGLRRV